MVNKCQSGLLVCGLQVELLNYPEKEACQSYFQYPQSYKSRLYIIKIIKQLSDYIQMID